MVQSFLKEHWRKIAAILAILALCVGCFALGRFGVAERVETKVEERLVEVAKVVEREVEKIVERKVYVAADKSKVKRSETVSPDGTIVRTEEIDSNVVTKETTDTDIVRVEFVEKVVEKEVEKRVEVVKEKPMPDWRVAPMVGVNIPEVPGLLENGDFDPFTHTTFGLALERRVLGPFFIGAWGLTTGQAGVSVSVEF